MKSRLEKFRGDRLITDSDELFEVMASDIIHELRGGQPFEDINIKELTEQALKNAEIESDAYLLEQHANNGLELSGSKRRDFIEKLTKAVRDHIILVVIDVLRGNFDGLSSAHEEAMDPKVSVAQRKRQIFSEDLSDIVKNLPHPHDITS